MVVVVMVGEGGTPDPPPDGKEHILWDNCEIAPEDILPTSKIQAEENNLWRIIHVTVRGYSALFIRLEFQGPAGGLLALLTKVGQTLSNLNFDNFYLN